MSTPVLVHVAFAPIGSAMDESLIREQFPDTRIAFVPYQLPHRVRQARLKDPDGLEARSGEPSLTDEQQAAFAGADVVLTLDAPRDLPKIAPSIRWLQAVGSGVGQLRACHLETAGVVVTTAAGVGAPAIAEWVLARLLSIYKRLDVHDAQQRSHRWARAHGDLAAGKTVAVVGLGAIGREVASRCGALGMEVVAIRRRPTVGRAEQAGTVSAIYGPERLVSVAGAADVVVAAVPGTPSTESMFNTSFFAAMRPGSIFINVGRGSSVDEDALLEALRRGHLRAAALDVTREEPLPAISPLWDAPNLYLSPHSATSSEGYMERLWALFVRNYAAFRTGRQLENLVEVAAEYGR